LFFDQNFNFSFSRKLFFDQNFNFSFSRKLFFDQNFNFSFSRKLFLTKTSIFLFQENYFFVTKTLIFSRKIIFTKTAIFSRICWKIGILAEKYNFGENRVGVKFLEKETENMISRKYNSLNLTNFKFGISRNLCLPKFLIFFLAQITILILIEERYLCQAYVRLGVKDFDRHIFC